MSQVTKSLIVVSRDTPTPNMVRENVALFGPDGEPLTPLSVETNQMPLQADSVAATVGALVTDFNALLTKLKNAEFMASA